MTKADSLYIFLDKESVIYKDLKKERGFCWGSQDNEAVTEFASAAFSALPPVSRDHSALRPPDRSFSPAFGDKGGQSLLLPAPGPQGC